MFKIVNSWRRWFGVLFLAVAFAMLTWGQTFLKPYLIGDVLLAYWLVFLMFTCSTVAIGLLDFFEVRRFFRLEQDRVRRRLQKAAALKARAAQQAPQPGSDATGVSSTGSAGPRSEKPN